MERPIFEGSRRQVRNDHGAVSSEPANARLTAETKPFEVAKLHSRLGLLGVGVVSKPKRSRSLPAQIHRRCLPRHCSEGQGNCRSRRKGYPCGRKGRILAEFRRPVDHVTAVTVREVHAWSPENGGYLGCTRRRNERVIEEPAHGVAERKLIIGDGPNVNGVADRVSGPPRTTAAETGADSKTLTARIPKEFLHGGRLRGVYTHAVRLDSPAGCTERRNISDRAPRRRQPQPAASHPLKSPLCVVAEIRPRFTRKPLRLALLRPVEEPEQIVDEVGRLALFRQIVGQQSLRLDNQRIFGTESGFELFDWSVFKSSGFL